MRIRRDNLYSGCHRVLLAAGVDPEQARSVADNLIWCDLVGRRNHGVERLPILLEHVAAGTIHCPSHPVFETLADNMQRMNAGQSFGHHAGRLAVDRACALAKQHGSGIVGVANSNFFGAGAYYTNLAAEHGMVSLVLSNSFPKVAAPGGIQAVLGTNPFAFGAPRKDGRALLVDMSTASVAGSTVREKAQKGELFPVGVAIDASGDPILHPEDILKGTLLPAAGAKGFGIALLVEILGAVLTGAGISQQVGSMYKDKDRAGENGHFILALDVSRWMPLENFFDRMDYLQALVSGSGPDGAVRLPGDTRWKIHDEQMRNGIDLEAATAKQINDLAEHFGVAIVWESTP